MKYKPLDKEKINPDEAFETHQRICKRELQRRALLVENIIDLQKMFDKQLYKAILGFDPPPVWSGYLGLIEIYYTRSEVERYRKIFGYFVGEKKYKLEDILDIPVTRLENIVNANPTEKLDELLEQARQLTSLEWKNALAETMGKPTSWECKHSMRLKQICSKCGIQHFVEVDKDIMNKLKVINE